MTPIARLIFLDIDGVLRTWPSTCPFYVNTFGRKVPSFNCKAVHALNWLVRATQAHVVISSAWRCQGVVKMQRDLSDWGVHASIYSMLPRDTDGLWNRSEQIDWWLARRRRRYPGFTSRFVILDDEPPAYDLSDQWIETTIEQGLTWELAEVAYALLLGRQAARA